MMLYGFGPKLGLVDPSPFVLKLHTFLRMSGVDYIVKNDFANLKKAPKGKLPFIKDDMQTVSDSSFIIDYLRQQHSIDLDTHLSEEQKNQAHFIKITIEESFYWCEAYFRWIHETSFLTIRECFFGDLPFPLKMIIPNIARRGVKKSLYHHGLGRHEQSEILAIAKTHFTYLAIFLRNKNFCFGNKPCSLDATLYAFLAQVTLSELDTPLSSMAKEYAELTEYCHRIQALYFSES